MENTIRKLFRDYNTMDPASILKQLGTQLHFVNIAVDGWFGAATFNAECGEYMVVINTHHPALRQHETLIHELAHIVLHHLSSTEHANSSEREADTFTRTFLQLEREV